MSYGPKKFAYMAVCLWKWELLRLGGEYDALLYADLDFDLLPASLHAAAVAAQWAVSLPRLAAQATRFGWRIVGYRDVTTP